MKEAVPQAKLDFWYTNKANVLLEGKHGVGKTNLVTATVEKHGLELGETWLYFSCATLDPWVDLVGIPTKTVGEDGVTYLDLVRPKAFAYDQVQFIFLDELNRAPKKVMNALMELLQFKSINGKKFKNLKMVWAAINPAATGSNDTNYHVEELDPAVLTRFQVRYSIPYQLSEDFFVKKHSKETFSRLEPWWNSLPAKIKDEFPPRSVHYALQMMKIGGDVADCLPRAIAKRHFLDAVTGKTPVAAQENKGSTGLTMRQAFGTVAKAKLKALVTSNPAKVRQLSNEDFLQVFFKLAVEPKSQGSKVLRIVPGHGDLLVAATAEQLNALLLVPSLSAQIKKVVELYIKQLPQSTRPNKIPKLGSKPVGSNSINESSEEDEDCDSSSDSDSEECSDDDDAIKTRRVQRAVKKAINVMGQPKRKLKG